MNVLEEWLNARGFEFRCERKVDDCVIFDPVRVVVINRNLSYHLRLVSLLHECGHVAIFVRRRRAGPRRVAGVSRREFEKDTGRCRKRSIARKIATIQEEIAAWDWGQKMAARLGIRYSRAVFERERARCLMTYVRWGAGKKKTRRPSFAK